MKSFRKLKWRVQGAFPELLPDGLFHDVGIELKSNSLGPTHSSINYSSQTWIKEEIRPISDPPEHPLNALKRWVSVSDRAVIKSTQKEKPKLK
jgi:hypothetical protein